LCSKPSLSEKSVEFFDGKTCVARDAAHGESIDRVMSGNRQDSLAIRHDDVLALSNDAKTRLLKGSDGLPGD
jgi:hypothetical protein